MSRGSPPFTPITAGGLFGFTIALYGALHSRSEATKVLNLKFVQREHKEYSPPESKIKINLVLMMYKENVQHLGIPHPFVSRPGILGGCKVVKPLSLRSENEGHHTEEAGLRIP